MKKFHYYKTVIKLLSLTLFLASFQGGTLKIDLVEKVYVHTDRSFYFPGETIWFKGYVTNSKNEIATLSDVVYAELISPKGSVVKKLTLKVSEGSFYGDFNINTGWVGGIYKLKMYTNWMKNYGSSAIFTKNITVQKIVQPKLLLKLEFGEETYGKGTTVKANFEAKDLKNNPLSMQRINYDVTVGGKKFFAQNFITDTNGEKEIAFKLPDTLNTTDVVLNVLIPYQGSFESISRSVPVLLNNVDLQFFPESGSAIVNTENQIAFKAINEFGKPADLSGIILDNNGKEVTAFKSFHDGMGSFSLYPQAGIKYYAKITAPFQSDSLIELPLAKIKGIKFSLKKTDDTKTTIEVYAPKKQTVLIKAENAASVVYQKKSNLKKGNNEITLNTAPFPMGITKFSILDGSGEVEAERLIFINKVNQLNIDISLDKKVYNTREQVLLKVKTTNKKNVPVPANLSVSVANNGLVSFANDKQDHILSSLLLSWELKGKIHKPVFYFDHTEEKSTEALDFVMLTHGWRNYITSPIPSVDDALYLPETDAVQNGVVVDKKGDPISANLLLFENNGDKVLEFKTNEKGEFAFKLNGYQTYSLVAYRKDKQKLSILKKAIKKASSVKQIPTRKPEKTKEDKTIPSSFKGVDKPIQEPIQQKAVSSISVALEADASALDEVVIVGYGTERKRSLTAAVTTIYANEITTGVTVNPQQILQGRAAGVQVTNTSGNSGNATKIKVRGVNTISGNDQPLYIVDGVVLTNVSDNNLSNINSADIASLTVLKGTAASSLYGSRGANGVVIISTIGHRYDSKRLRSATYNNYAFKNFYSSEYNRRYYRAKSFYVPIYDAEDIPEERTDFRNTIYWNPIVQTDENGEAEIRFYNSDDITSFRITAEGIGYNGLVGRKTKDYSTKKLLNVNFKAPNYLSLNDTVVLPITITNETEKLQQISFTLELPKHLKIVDKEKLKMNFEIPKDSFVLKNIAVIPVKKGKDLLISAMAKTKEHTDKFTHKTEIISPYFPTEASISGFKNQAFILPVNNVVPGSLKAEFNIYTDVIGDVMNGVESLIRRPWGCFEQVSSATYPNILILKYLKETGKTNPEIERRALDFIKKGYKKLAGYETNQNGFEWYGRTPPHEALSAYGVLEFTEMKEVYKGVDPNLIERTVKWLMSRRDGKGGFKQKRGKYGFSAAPKHVNNAYIVYAISESGVSANLEKEFMSSWDEALRSNDAYRMALMALSSFNLKKATKASLLMDKIKTNIEKSGFSKLKTESTITYSYGDAREIETAAFTVLALLKEGNSEDLVTKGIEFILSKRKHGRFGSTQSTSMALKALIAYTKKQKEKIIDENSGLMLTINQHEISQKLEIDNDGSITIPGIEKYIKEGLQEIQVVFTNPEVQFPYALDIQWDSYIPNSSKDVKVNLNTTIVQKQFRVGDNVRMNIALSNKEKEGLPMVTAIIGIPSGTTAQPWQLKELIETEKVAYYEVFDNYLVFYWREMAPSETKSIALDLKADVPGSFQAPASTAYLYYTDEFKHWITGNKISIDE